MNQRGVNSFDFVRSTSQDIPGPNLVQEIDFEGSLRLHFEPAHMNRPIRVTPRDTGVISINGVQVAHVFRNGSNLQIVIDVIPPELHLAIVSSNGALEISRKSPMFVYGQRVTVTLPPGVISEPNEVGMDSDASTAHFDLERTEHCWRDECFSESSERSETGLCEKCLDALRKPYLS